MSALDIDDNLLEEITHRLELRQPNAEALASAACAVSQHFDVEHGSAPFECIVDSATGVGKTFVMAGLLEYFAGRQAPSRNFLLLAPGRTIRDKSITNFTPGHRKSLTAAMKSQPVIVTADNFKSPAVVADMLDPAKTKLFIFTVQALTSNTSDEGRATHEYQETLGRSLFAHLANLDDLVILADEHHCYRGPAFSRTITSLNPQVVFGLTATPAAADSGMIVYRYPLAKAIHDKFVKTPVLVARNDDLSDDMTKLLDGVTLLRYKEEVAAAYCAEHNLAPVKPVMLVIAQDTDAANAYRDMIDSEAFDGGAWAGRTLLVHSNLSGDEKEKALAALDSVESPDSDVRIIISVGMLKEGWDVKNVYVIASMRPSISDVLTEQTLGRGMRLPFGTYTGEPFLDSLEVLAHERYEEILRKREALNEKFVDYAVWMQIREENGELVAVKEQTESEQAQVFGDGSTGSSPAETGSAASGTDEGAAGSEAPAGAPVKDFDKVAGEARAKAEQAKESAARVHLPLAAREPIVVPYIESIPHYVPVSLNQIADLAPFRALAALLSVEASDELKRTKLTPTKDGSIKGTAAEGHILAARLDLPIDETHAALVEAVLNAPGVQRRPSELNQAKKIVDTLISEMGPDAAVQLAAYRDMAVRRLRSAVMDQMTAIATGGTTFQDEVRLEPLSKERRFAKEHVDEQVAVFERGKAYGGWSRSLYEFATFDSSPEYAVAKAVDGADEVVVWARLHINDIPIEWTSGGRKYNPDFAVVEEVDGERTSWLVEVKSNRDAGSEDVQAKRLAAITWANTVTNSDAAGTWRYLLLTEDDVAQTHGNWKQMKTLA